MNFYSKKISIVETYINSKYAILILLFVNMKKEKKKMKCLILRINYNFAPQ